MRTPTIENWEITRTYEIDPTNPNERFLFDEQLRDKEGDFVLAALTRVEVKFWSQPADAPAEDFEPYLALYGKRVTATGLGTVDKRQRTPARLFLDDKIERTICTNLGISLDYPVIGV
jgi:hypothetical protein